MAQVGGAQQTYGDPYANEPKRHGALIVRSQQPFNAETPVEFLSQAKLTPNDLFYVRNHLPVPKVDSESWKVRLWLSCCCIPVQTAGYRALSVRADAGQACTMQGLLHLRWLTLYQQRLACMCELVHHAVYCLVCRERGMGMLQCSVRARHALAAGER